MNEELIEKFANLSYDPITMDVDLNHFAKLIVNDCLKMCKTGVGSSDYNTGRMHCHDNIKEHFGIK